MYYITCLMAFSRGGIACCICDAHLIFRECGSSEYARMKSKIIAVLVYM